MEFEKVAYAIGALLFVMGLISLCALLLRKYGSQTMISKRHKEGKTPEITIEDSVVLDSKRRVVLLKRKNTEIMLLVGPDRELVLDKQTSGKNA